LIWGGRLELRHFEGIELALMEFLDLVLEEGGRAEAKQLGPERWEVKVTGPVMALDRIREGVRDLVVAAAERNE
jgi:hypothetical protein